MDGYVIAYDLGTGGNKTSLYDEQGRCVAESFIAYPTSYPRPGWHEQRPQDWWDAIVAGTSAVLASSAVDPSGIVACGISGHSLGAVPLRSDGTLLREATPIWSDTRATAQAAKFFGRTSEPEWYAATGNGFPAHLYSVFKTMWYRDNEPDMLAAAAKVIGTKDFINYRLTGVISTDHSYASGTGVYDLTVGGYDADLLAATGLPAQLLPEIVSSTDVLGELTAEAAEALGLPRGVSVVSGGVDNSCMALGARAMKPGRVYNSMGSSSWIAVTSASPLIDDRIRPYVFAHVVPGLFTSAVSTFAAGTSFRWVRDNLCRDLIATGDASGADVYELMTAEAASSPPGANGVLFNPSMAGGTSLNTSPEIRGAFLSLDLRSTRSDLIRAAMEGIAVELRIALDELRRLTTLSDEMLVVGGGIRSELWREILANAYDITIVKSNIDQQAAALGAAACAAVGSGVWDGFEFVDDVHELESTIPPNADTVAVYERMMPLFAKAEAHLSDLGDQVTGTEL